MGKLHDAVHSVPLACIVAATLLMGGTGCTSNKAGMAAPEMPAKHWLEDAPGIPVENKDKYDQAVPNLYTPGKKFNFEDCVYLTIQQSPMLVNSAVKIEIDRLAQQDAAWKYLPELHLSLRVSQNLTQYNTGIKGLDGEYGKTAYEVGFYAPFPNPVATYYEQKARSMLTGVAITTHRKAVAQAIYGIGRAYLELQARQYTLAAQKSLIPLTRELTAYWRQVEKVDGSQGAAVSISQQHEREAELSLERAVKEEEKQRSKLKALAGLDPRQPFNIDVSHADDMLKGFDGKKLRWEELWEQTEDNLLLRTQLKLADYNIMLGWAQYFPGMSLSVNMNPPRGQSQPTNGTDDYFAHMSFDFPVLDWGRRYRGVQTARMRKAQAFHQVTEKRVSYSNNWLEAEQDVDLALTNMQLAQNRYKTAQMQYEEARIGYESGIENLPAVADRQANMVREQINFINAQRDYRLAQLRWMYVAELLQQHFLGLPSKELSALVGGNRPTAPRPSFEKGGFGAAQKSAPVFGAGALTPGSVKPQTATAAPKTTAAPDSAKDMDRPIGKVRPEKIPDIPESGNADLRLTPTL